MIRLFRMFQMFTLVSLAACAGEAKDTADGAADDGAADGATDGTADGATDGAADGAADGGSDDGATDGGSDDGSGDGGLPVELMITGTWDDSWGGQHEIDSARWLSDGSSFEISVYDNALSYAIAQNGAENPYNPGLWSRFDWGTSGGDVFYCQTAYDAESEAAALATPAAALSDLDGGCGGFSWTELRPALSINGDWNDGWGGVHNINAFTWTSGTSTFAITQADEAAGSLVAQNGAANPWSPGLWSRFDWVWDAEGQLWYCQTAYDAPDEAAALATPAADDTDPSSGGCGGFSWTGMVRPD